MVIALIQAEKIVLIIMEISRVEIKGIITALAAVLSKIMISMFRKIQNKYLHPQFLKIMVFIVILEMESILIRNLLEGIILLFNSHRRIFKIWIVSSPSQ